MGSTAALCPRRQLASGAVVGGGWLRGTVGNVIHSQPAEVTIVMPSAVRDGAGECLVGAVVVGAEAVGSSCRSVDWPAVSDSAPVLCAPAAGVLSPRAGVMTAGCRKRRGRRLRWHGRHAFEHDEKQRRPAIKTSSVVAELRHSTFRCQFVSRVKGHHLAAGPAACLHHRHEVSICADQRDR